MDLNEQANGIRLFRAIQRRTDGGRLVPPWAPRTGNDGHPIGPQPSHGRGTMGTLKGTRMGTMGTPKGPTDRERWARPRAPRKGNDGHPQWFPSRSATL